jgi:GMP synthase-like glutamine amidotransferase
VKILIIDNTIDPSSWGAEDIRRCAREALLSRFPANSATISVRRAPERDLPASPRGFDRIILSGSKTSALEDGDWISELHEFVQKTLAVKIPFLGVCYGHQVLSRVLGGKESCRKSKTPEYGWSKIEVLQGSALSSGLLKGLPKTFYSFSAHCEEVAELPSALKNLASSESCRIQACQLGDQPVYGIQFHPERDAEGAIRSFKEKSKVGLLHPGRSKELYNPAVGQTIFGNFLQ